VAAGQTSCTFDQNPFNTYQVNRQPDVRTVLSDGKVCLVDHPLTGQEPFDQPFFLALTQALGIGSNAPTAATPASATTQVAWVRACPSVEADVVADCRPAPVDSPFARIHTPIHTRHSQITPSTVEGPALTCNRQAA
jgi:hypothetical protein